MIKKIGTYNILLYLYSVINRLLTKINFEMKKLSLVLAGLALAAFSFTSCKGDFTCDCTYTYTVGDTEYTYEYSYDYLKYKKSDAEDACEVYNGYEGYECTLSKK